MKFSALAVLAIVSASPAVAGTPLTVNVDHTQMVMLSDDPGSIVVGNPAIADVSLNGRQMFLNGHAYGDTNLMIFDQEGKKIADYEVSVTHDSPSEVTMFMGQTGGSTLRYTYSCTPKCEGAIMAGDSQSWINSQVSNARLKNDLAQGVKTTDLISRNGNAPSPGALNAPPQSQ